MATVTTFDGKATGEGLREPFDPGPFLSSDHIPDEAWRRMRSGQRLLHTFWTEKFFPLFYDYRRVRCEHLPKGDRRTIRAVLGAISRQRIRFDQPFTYQPRRGVGVTFVQAKGTIEGQRMTTNVLVITADETAERPTQWISFEAYGIDTDVKVVLEWRPQATPERGSVYLRPQAALSRYQFGIAAFNREQFAAIEQALVEYMAAAPAGSQSTVIEGQ